MADGVHARMPSVKPSARHPLLNRVRGQSHQLHLAKGDDPVLPVRELRDRLIQRGLVEFPAV
jgi:hypothetical protein